jgi:mannose/fructose-specific phosphotransferase system component IIA
MRREVDVRPFRIVVAGHGEFGAALLSAAALIVGPIDDAVSVALDAHETPDGFAERLRAAIGHDHRRVLVLCDLLGGTPYNVAAAIARRSDRVVSVSGANLPLLIEAALATTALDDPLVERLIEGARDGIVETERHRARRAS